jgi:hypothetical protein
VFEGHGRAEQAGVAGRPGERVVDQRADEGVLCDRRQDTGARRRVGEGSAEAGIGGELEGAPLEEDATGVARVAEAHLGAGAGCDVHVLLLQVGHGGLNVVDLQGDRVHAAAEPGDELGRSALADRLADLDCVVAGPGHAAPPPDARLGGLVVFEDGEPDEDAEVPDGQVVVGHHRRGVEQPADVVRATRGHRPAAIFSCSRSLPLIGDHRSHEGLCPPATITFEDLVLHCAEMRRQRESAGPRHDPTTRGRALSCQRMP